MQVGQPTPYLACKCDCGQMIDSVMRHVEIEADGVLWHGNAQGGGHRADFDRSVLVTGDRNKEQER